MAAEAPRYGQLARAGNGTNGSASAAKTAAPQATSTVSSSLSDPALIMLFHVACKAAPQSTRSITARDTRMPPGRGVASGTRRHHRGQPGARAKRFGDGPGD